MRLQRRRVKELFIPSASTLRPLEDAPVEVSKLPGLRAPLEEAMLQVNQRVVGTLT